jgi:hypothetical protein
MMVMIIFICINNSEGVRWLHVETNSSHSGRMYMCEDRIRLTGSLNQV